MPRLLVLNPNTTAAMTRSIGAVARSAAQPDTEVVARNPASGPASIEGPYDHALCMPAMLAEVARAEREGCHATVIACFDDPGVAAARCIATGPVIGIAEAAMRAAVIIASRFAVVTTVGPAVTVIEELAVRYGANGSCAAVRAADVAVLGLTHVSAATYRRVRDTAMRAVRNDRAEAIVLGCAGMAALAARLSRDLDVPVVDGVAAAVKLAEALVALGLRTSKQGSYASPRRRVSANTMGGLG
ncbi:MAG TPA: aspartate/glutamate racemase family protein [Casimicrobiaceae bacterium]|jgi:allantoin racemase